MSGFYAYRSNLDSLVARYGANFLSADAEGRAILIEIESLERISDQMQAALKGIREEFDVRQMEWESNGCIAPSGGISADLGCSGVLEEYNAYVDSINSCVQRFNNSVENYQVVRKRWNAKVAEDVPA